MRKPTIFRKPFCYRTRFPSLPALLSFFCFLAAFSLTLWRGAKAIPPLEGTEKWLEFYLPCFGAALYGVLSLNRHGKTYFSFFSYLLLLPVFWFGSSTPAFILLISHRKLRTFFCWAIVLLLAWIYYASVRRYFGGKFFLILAHFSLLGMSLFRIFRILPTTDLQKLSEVLMPATLQGGILFYLACWQVVELPGRIRRRGDRSDGRRLRTLPPMDCLTPYFMPDRIGAANLYRDEFDIANAEQFILQKRQEGYKGFGLMHILVAAYVRTISQKPMLNRFISGQHIYSREEDVVISLAIKKSMKASAPETVVKFNLKSNMTLEEVYHILTDEISKNKTDVLDADMDKAAGIVKLLPGLLLKFFVWCLNTLDYFGLMPKSLMDISPFHGSMFLTSMGSLGISPVNHHLYSFGNIPVFLAFGPKMHRYIPDGNGGYTEKRYCEFTVSLDDRICDGFSYATAFKVMKRYVTHPELLETPPEVVYRDVD